MELEKLSVDVKVLLAITISEKVFMAIDKSDERYLDGREALDKCWKWCEDRSISGDDLYEIIDNAECVGISEFAEAEEDLSIARLWSLLVDTVAYTAWMAYEEEKTIYLPQMIEGISEESIFVIIESAIKTGFITQREIDEVVDLLLLEDGQNSISKSVNKESILNQIIHTTKE
ncbi:MAG: hypothetical protein IKK33_06845 [Lachnospiraceae bacterium]|nr:hypothetical protein [Lachnospiraceae bacterium]